MQHCELGQVPFTSTAGGLIHTGGRQDHCRKTSGVGVRGREGRRPLLGLGVSLLKDPWVSSNLWGWDW